MLTINTNLSSLIAQQNIKTSTSKLNQAIERMTTGFKVNRASDNAANYAIANQMTTKLNSLQVAEENTAMGIDLINTAEATLTQMQDRIERLRALQEQANNNTYGEDSLIAINKECNMLVNEINRLYESAEYNGITLFMAPTTLADGSVVIARESDAQLDTTFKEIGVTVTHFEIFDSNNNFVQAYDLEVNDTINDFLSTLQTHGFSTKLRDGEITISSADGSYITGDLVDELGISTTQQSYVASTQQSYSKNIETTSAQVSASTVFTTTTNTSTATETIWITTTTSETLTNTIWTTTTTSETLTNTIEITTTIDVINTITVENITNSQVLESEELTLKSNFVINPKTYTDEEVAAMTKWADVSYASSGKKYSISSVEELQKLAEYVNTNHSAREVEFVLACDIDLASVSNWTPIGIYSDIAMAFSGTFDGNGHIIKNLTIDNETEYNQGLFGIIGAYATVKNVGIEGGSVKGLGAVGGLAGNTESLTTISNCYTMIEVSGVEGDTGGLIGSSSTSISDCYATGNVTSSGNHTGGLVGNANYYSTISRCYATGDVTSSGEDTGGLVGLNGGATSMAINNCYATGAVNGYVNTGGLVGRSQGTSSINLSNSYATGIVNGEVLIGGLVGTAYAGISNCYSTGDVIGRDTVGGLVARSSASAITNCYAIGNVTGTTTSSSITNSTDWDGTNFTYDYSSTYVFTTPASLSTTLSELGLASSTTLLIKETNGNTLVSINSTNSLQNILDSLNAITGYNAVFNDNILTITSSGVNGIDTDSSFFTFIPTVSSTLYNTITSTHTETVQQEQTTTSIKTTTTYVTNTIESTETQTIYTTTTSSTTQTVTLYVTTTSSTTQTSTVWVTSTVAATGGTKFEELGVSSAFIVTIVSDGTRSALTINKTSTFDEFFALLESKGFVVSENTGKIELNASGDTYIYSTFLNNLLKMSSVNKTEALKTVNTKSDYQSFDEILEDVYAPGTINLLVGTSAEPECSISVDVSFKLSDLTKFRNIGVDGNDYLDQIDSLLAQISDRQVQFGATLNRLDSVMDEIGIKYDNLVSSRSTIRDADIADVSAIYIQQQILQQASATLLATANQSPSIALQLI